MPVPHAVDDRPPGERVLGVGDPARQGRAAGRFVVIGCDRKPRRQAVDAAHGPRHGRLAGLMDIAALEHVHRPRLARRHVAVIGEEVARRGENQGLRGQCRQLGLQPGRQIRVGGSVALISSLSPRLIRSSAGSAS